MFGGREAPAQQATFEPDEEMEAAEAALKGGPAATRQGPTAQQITAIKAAIASATTLEEVRRLEDALKTGTMPSGTNGAAAMEEG
jgi:U2 small nuclear ribonucleoprotein A'